MLYFSKQKMLPNQCCNKNFLQLLTIEIVSLPLHYFPYSKACIWIHVPKYRQKLKCMLTSARL